MVGNRVRMLYLALISIVATRLVDSLERLLGMPSSQYIQLIHCRPSLTSEDALNDTLIQSMLALLQGILLLHPPSRTVFQNDSHMNVLLDLLDVAIIPEIQSQALLVLVSALLATPTNTRTFEKQDGLLTVASLFKSRSTAKQVKMKAVEFFYFYLMPESSTAGSQKAEDRKGQARTEDAHRPMAASVLRTTSEKQQMLGKYLNNVAELVQDLQEATPMPIAV